MIGICQDTGFRNMVALAIHALFRRASRTVPDNSQGFKLNFYICIAMAFLAHMTRKKRANALLKSVLEAARSIKDKVQFYYYRIADGISELLRHAHAGIRDWFKPKRPNQNQLCFRLPA